VSEEWNPDLEIKMEFEIKEIKVEGLTKKKLCEIIGWWLQICITDIIQDDLPRYYAMKEIVEADQADEIFDYLVDVSVAKS
jgi:hypothetical protein